MYKKFFEIFVMRLENGNILLEGEKRRANLGSALDLLRQSGKKKMIFCDDYIRGIESMEAVKFENYGFCYFCEAGEIINVDHHAPLARFKRFVTATELAVKYYRVNGSADEDTLLVIDHTDTDSILSLLIISGILDGYSKWEKKKWEDIFISAAHDADYTGKENDISDLLQSAEFRNDIRFSVKNLFSLLEAGETAIDHIARELYLERRAMRREITRAISHGNFENRLERFGDKNVKCVYDEMGKVGFIKVSEKTSLGDPAFWISAIKNVWMLLIFMPEDGEKHARRSAVKSESARKKWIVRGRITIEGDGITFDDLHMNDFDPFWTCKWNSGSNWSRGGTELDPMYYTELVSTRVDNLKRRRFSFEMSMQRSLEKETCQTVRYSKPSA